MKNVQSGYYTRVGFTTRLKDWVTPVTPPGMNQDDYDGDEVYRAADGKVFTDYDKAKKYNETLTIPELDEVFEQIEKLKLLCLASKDKAPVLETIADGLGTLAKDPDYMMDKYYDSTCY